MKVLLFANTDWYLYNFRRSLALAIQASGYEVLLVSPPGEYGQRLRDLGLRWEPIRMDRRSLNPIREAALLVHLASLMRRERIDLVHGFTIKSAVYGALAGRLAGTRARVSAVAGLGYVFTSFNLKARLLRPLVKGLLRLTLGGNGARLILQNPDDVALFKRAGLIEASRIRLIHGSGVDCRRFTPRVARIDASGSAAPRVLLAARLLWDKGLGEYAQAARILREQGREVIFLLAGTPDMGNPGAVPEGTVRGWMDEGLLQWLGHVEDMGALFASVDIVTLPSYYGEGLPKSLIEAAACALPLVTTDIPGCREVVANDEVDGLRVPPRDANALAKAIGRLLDDPNFAAKLGQAARAKALAQFDERIVIERTLAVYEELLGPSPEISLRFHT
ncbi:glycosyltransferase family 4 protein [Rhodanobacter sp. IGA1.0]|uniref:Glycosyltransferase family 4 protein n=1 Tax=Rhodanobacter sp. IGA1.0 TaxID=3158582 RepID=A0AAU7QMP9_9GAMM